MVRAEGHKDTGQVGVLPKSRPETPFGRRTVTPIVAGLVAIRIKTPKPAALTAQRRIPTIHGVAAEEAEVGAGHGKHHRSRSGGRGTDARNDDAEQVAPRKRDRDPGGAATMNRPV